MYTVAIDKWQRAAVHKRAFSIYAVTLVPYRRKRVRPLGPRPIAWLSVSRLVGVWGSAQLGHT
jgi:hypothetical protein